MKKEYELHGMSCGGCVSTVKRALLQVQDVIKVEVELNPPGSVITMSTSIDVKELQTRLTQAGHYTIKELVSK